MATYWPTPGLKGKTFKLCVLTRWDFNFRSSPLRGAGTQHGDLPQLSVMMSRVTYSILRAHTGTGVSHSQHKKNSRDVWGKNADEWTKRVKLARKKSLAVGLACRTISGPVPGFKKKRTFAFWVPNRWVFHFCVWSTPLRSYRHRRPLYPRVKKRHYKLLPKWRLRGFTETLVGCGSDIDLTNKQRLPYTNIFFCDKCHCATRKT